MAVEATVPVETGTNGAQREEAPAPTPTRADASYVAPPVDIFEDDQGLVVLADLPGVEPGAPEVRTDDGILTIQGKARHLAPGEPVHREYELTGYYRQFRLAEEVDPARATAELKHGVLTVRLPRSPRAEPRRIEVRPA